MSSAPPPHRRQSASRGPPMLPPGMPVRADHAKQTIVNNNNNNNTNNHKAPSAHMNMPMPHSHSQQRFAGSMPPPGPSPKTTASGAPRAQRAHPSPARPSPNPSSHHSADSLRESTRVNIRPSPRQPSSTLAWDETKSPQEPWLVTPKEQHSSQVKVRDEVDLQFDQLLENLQIADSVRQKFSTVSLDVKSSILHSSNASNPAILSSLGLPSPAGKENPRLRKRISTPRLRKAKSSSSLGSPGPNPEVGKTYQVEGDQFVIVASPLSSPNPMSPLSPMSPTHRGQSFDLSRPRAPKSRGSGSLGPRPMSLFGASTSSGKGLNIVMGEQPDAFVKWLNMYKGTDLKMEVERAKKLRMLLRHETTEWVRGFLEMGGYKLILARLQDLLDVEWREEQHDDQMLYELLRCIKALCTSEIGKTALRAHFPAPFPALSSLLFSEKKPGDLAPRQIIVELWLLLFDLFPSRAQSPNPSSSRPGSVRFDTNHMAGMGPDRHPVDITAEVRKLLIPEKPDPRAEQHEFITKVHRPKVFQAWVAELSDICRDYFWIMCHAKNTLWALDEVDESRVEKPIAPGGATGGVEFEAMNYVTMHFRLLNALCRNLAAENRDKACQLHYDLLSSGMDRILLTMRKASTTYYPTLHLELARYVALLRGASPNARLPHLIDHMVGSPPEELRRWGGSAASGKQSSLGGGSGGGRRGAWDMQN